MCIEAKLDLLARVLADAAPGLVAVSGGVDSRFLSFFAWSRGLDFEAVFLDGPHLSPLERSWTREWLHRNAPGHHVLFFSPLEIPQIRDTDVDRCYHCKLRGFERIVELGKRLGRSTVFDGVTSSDMGEYRPGLRALRELGVRSPLAACGFSKSEIRAAAAHVELDWPEQPSRPCLLTRLNYGLQAEEPTLERIGRAEDALFELGLRDFRLRLLSAGQAVLHVADAGAATLENKRDAVRAALDAHGFGTARIERLARLSGFFDKRKE